MDKRGWQQIAQIGIKPDSNTKNHAKIDHSATQLITNDEVIERDVYKHLRIYKKYRNILPTIPLVILDDNQAVCTSLAKGRTNAMRHVHCTHRVNIDCLYGIGQEPNITIRYVNT